MAAARHLKGTPRMVRLGAGEMPGGPHVALVPGAEAPVLPLDLPESLRGMARERVAKRQLVEQLSMPEAAFEMHPLTPKGQRIWDRVLVVDAAKAAAWRKALRPGAIALLPDYLALPAAEGLWAVEVAGGAVRARLGPGDGFGAEPDLAAALLDAAPAPKAILRLGDPEPVLDAALEARGVPVLRDAAALRGAGLAPMRWSEATGGIDLKAPASAVYDRLRARLGQWRAPVAFGTLALAMWLAAVAVEMRRFGDTAARDAERTRALVREHFVPSGPILDIRRQVTAAAEAAAAPATAEAVALAPLVQLQIAAPILTHETLRLQTAAYRADTGLVITVEATDFAALDRLLAELDAAAFVVEQLDSRAQQAGGVVARLRLEVTS